VASLQARSPLRSAHPLFFINKLVSLAAFLFLLGAGWVALCYLKTEMLSRWNGAAENAPTSSKNLPVKVEGAAPPQVKQLSAPIKLVYSCAGDNEYYHVATHLPARCERTALSEEAALQRGLKHCRICMPE
jgi:hypothetical protein